MKQITRKSRALGFERLEGREMMATWGPADLYGMHLNAPASAEWGQNFDVTARIRNAAAYGSAAFDVQWFLSMDSAGSPGDVPLQLANGNSMYRHSSLGANSYGSQFTVSLRLPDVVPVGLQGREFHLVMKTDASSEVMETVELNNFGQRGLGQDRDTIAISMPAAQTAFADASQDATPTRVFTDGALRLKFDPAQYGTRSNPLTSFTVEAVRSGRVVAVWHKLGADPLVNLHGYNLDGGDYLFRVQGNFKLTGTQTLAQTTITLQQRTHVDGSYLAETLDFISGGRTYGWAFNGHGGTDTLRLNVLSSTIVGLNGRPLSELATSGSGVRQALYRGTAWDFLELSDGREIYFQGIERLQFSNGYTLDLLVKPNDPEFAHQWNLHIQDVPTAWRFTQGSGDVLLVSLDSGVLPTVLFPTHGVVDQDDDRLIVDEYDDQGFVNNSYSHGHMAISVMAGAANNGLGVAGINWNSQVLVMDVYNNDEGSAAAADPYVSFITHMEQALDLARSTGRRVVFQGGIQGESWLRRTGEYTQQELRDLFTANQDITLFAIAAGNGNEDIDDTTPLDYGRSGGVARLASAHGNVIAVGAAFPNASGNHEADHELISAAGLDNASAINRASYSNYGRSLTLMAPTDSPAARNDGTIDSFGGTSCANPNMAGVASLLWSVLPNFDAVQIRQILVHTATDMFGAGHDAETGFGLVNADAAVRRAMALARDPELALLGMPMTPVTFPAPYITSWPSFGGSNQIAPPIPPAMTSPTSQETDPLLADQIFADEQFLADLETTPLEGDKPVAMMPISSPVPPPAARQMSRGVSRADVMQSQSDTSPQTFRRHADAALTACEFEPVSLLDPQILRAAV